MSFDKSWNPCGTCLRDFNIEKPKQQANQQPKRIAKVKFGMDTEEMHPFVEANEYEFIHRRNLPIESILQLPIDREVIPFVTLVKDMNDGRNPTISLMVIQYRALKSHLYKYSIRETSTQGDCEYYKDWTASQLVKDYDIWIDRASLLEDQERVRQIRKALDDMC